MKKKTMKNPVTNPLQNDGIQILAELEAAYRALQNVLGDLQTHPSLETDPAISPRIHKVMGTIQECQRDMMLRTAVLCGMETEIKKS